jgi:hypothetical protein
MERKSYILAMFITLVAAFGLYGVFYTLPSSEINSFDSCIKAGYPVMESYPRQCKTADGRTFVEELCKGMSITEAKQIAASECGLIKETWFCNENTNTWWIDLDMKKEGCNPACVINTDTKKAEVIWRCTGLLPPR